MTTHKKSSSQFRTIKAAKTLGSVLFRAGLEATQQKITKLKNDDLFVSQAALRLTQGLDDLKGAAMKVGQMISMFDEKTLPPGWKDALSRLQAKATPKEWKEIEPLLKSELGSLDAFASINPHAVHAASIGQVHRGRLKDGTEVAIKVQYPDLEKSMRADLKNMKRFFKLAQALPRMGSYDHVFSALETLFAQELDFEQEKDYYTLYRSVFCHGLQTKVVIPRPIEHLCRKKVLITEWVTATGIDSWIEQNKKERANGDPEATLKRDELGALLCQVVLQEVICLNCIQSDPNPGNFLVTAENELALLDFGATQPLDLDLVQNYVQLCHATLSRKETLVIDCGLRLGFLTEQDSGDVRDLFLQLMMTAMEPFFGETYSWQDCGLSQKLNSLSLRFLQQTHFRAPQSQILFLNRRFAGNLLLMEKLGPTLRARELFFRIFKDDFSHADSNT